MAFSLIKIYRVVLNFRFARLLIPTLPVHQSIGYRDKHVSHKSNCKSLFTSCLRGALLKPDAAQKRLAKEKYELRRRVFFSRHGSKIALVRTRGSINGILQSLQGEPDLIATRILPTTELNMNIVHGRSCNNVWNLTNNCPRKFWLIENWTGIASDPI